MLGALRLNEINYMKLEPTEIHYTAQLNASEYDTLDVIESTEDGRITFKLLESRWRTKKETIALLKEVIALLEK